MKKKIVIIFSVILIIFVSFILFKWNAIFQRGNPIPYLTAMTQLLEENTFVAIDDSNEIFITKNGNSSQLFDYIEKYYNVEFIEQYGNISVFNNEDKTINVYSEVYLSNYTVWSLSEG